MLSQRINNAIIKTLGTSVINYVLSLPEKFCLSTIRGEILAKLNVNWQKEREESKRDRDIEWYKRERERGERKRDKSY